MLCVENQICLMKITHKKKNFRKFELCSHFLIGTVLFICNDFNRNTNFITPKKIE